MTAAESAPHRNVCFIPDDQHVPPQPGRFHSAGEVLGFWRAGEDETGNRVVVIACEG